MSLDCGIGRWHKTYCVTKLRRSDLGTHTQPAVTALRLQDNFASSNLRKRYPAGAVSSAIRRKNSLRALSHRLVRLFLQGRHCHSSCEVQACHDFSTRFPTPSRSPIRIGARCWEEEGMDGQQEVFLVKWVVMRYGVKRG